MWFRGQCINIYIYIHWDYIYILNIDIDIEPYWKDPGLAWQFADLVSLKEMLVAAAQAGKYEPDPLLPFDLEPSEELFKRYVAHYFSHG